MFYIVHTYKLYIEKIIKLLENHKNLKSIIIGLVQFIDNYVSKLYDFDCITNLLTEKMLI